TVIFDLDGTLLNTLDDLRDSVNAILSSHGFPLRTNNEIKQFLGNGVGPLMRLAVPSSCTDKEVAIYLDEFKQHYEQNMDNKTRPFDGIMEVLIDLHRFNYNMAIVSNKFDAAVKTLSKAYFCNLFPVSIGESPSVRKKPAPDSVLTAIKELGADIKKTIYVGDSDVDVMTAKNAGIPCIGVTWGFRSREVLRNAGADYLIDTPREIFTIL
ncbi:MAG TPA: HAD family hydrolase, partial [Clostridiales bacterium]|nr:HAD family hydrolase [Clostridiales bacterium]